MLSADEFSYALRSRLGLPLYDELLRLPCACRRVDANEKDPYHPLICPAVRHKGWIQRHNLILHAIAEFARRANLKPEVEPSNMSEGDRKKPDLIFYTPTMMHIIDVTVNHPLTQAHTQIIHNKVKKNQQRQPERKRRRTEEKKTEEEKREEEDERKYESEQEEKQEQEEEEDETKETAESDLSAIESDEEERVTNCLLTRAHGVKKKKYAEMITTYRARFTTAAVYTLGGWSREFRAMMEVIAKEILSGTNGWEDRELLEGMKWAAAVAIHKGNARLINANRNQILKSHLYYNRHSSTDAPPYTPSPPPPTTTTTAVTTTASPTAAHTDTTTFSSTTATTTTTAAPTISKARRRLFVSPFSSPSLSLTHQHTSHHHHKHHTNTKIQGEKRRTKRRREEEEEQQEGEHGEEGEQEEEEEEWDEEVEEVQEGNGNQQSSEEEKQEEEYA
jgi:hypothetical protein